MDLESRVKELEAKLRELSDKDELRDLRCRYHECINESMRAEIPGLFTEDGELDFGPLGSAKGRAKIAEFFGVTKPAPEARTDRPRLPPFSKVKQYQHNHVVTVNGDRGSGYAYLEAKPLIAGKAYRLSGRYDDQYSRVDGRWLFKSMRLTLYYALPFSQDWAAAELNQIDKARG